MLNSKIMRKKVNSSFMGYADFESILVAEDNRKQNSKESYANKYQKMLLAIMTIYVDVKFSKAFKALMWR